MTDRRALMALIRSDPDDDAPRLVLADALQQRGDPYGEFIAAQCALARDDDDNALAAKERALWGQHADAWCAALGVSRGQVHFTRGFVSALTLHGWTPPSAAVSEHPIASISMEIGARSGPTPEERAALITWFDAHSRPCLRYHRLSFGLTEEDFAPVPALDELLEALLRAVGMGRVSDLDVALFLVRPAADIFSILMENPALDMLETLHWHTSALWAPHLAALLSSEPCRSLRELSLGNGLLSVQGAVAPAWLALPATLNALRIACGGEGDAEHFSFARPLEGLERLDWRISLPPQSLARILHTHGSQLRRLGLRGCRIDSGHIRALAAAPQLRELDLSKSKIDESTLVELAQTLPPGTISALDLSENRGCLSNVASVEALSQILAAPRELLLHGTALVARGLAQLAASGVLSHLERLSLDTLDEVGTELLDTCAPALRALEIQQCKLPSIELLARGTLPDRLRELKINRLLDKPLGEALAAVPFRRLKRLACSPRDPGAFEALQASDWSSSLDERLREGPSAR